MGLTWYDELLRVRTPTGRRRPPPAKRRLPADPAEVAASQARALIRRQRELIQQGRRLARVSRMSLSLERRRVMLAAAAAWMGLDLPTLPAAGDVDFRFVLQQAKAACAEPASRLAALALEGAEALEDGLLRLVETHAIPACGPEPPSPSELEQQLEELGSLIGGLERVAPDEAFADCERLDTLDLRRLRSFRGRPASAGSEATPSGAVIESALRRCRPNYADRDHWRGEDGSLLRRIAGGASLLEVVRDGRAASPVRLFTPLGAPAFSAVLTRDVHAGAPIAQYAGELLSEADEEPETNTYMYELDVEEMRARGYEGPALRISARDRGGVARFVNDRWAPPPLPPRRPNVFVALVLDPKARLPMLVLFASEPIAKGAEALLDYGRAYWRVAARMLLREHALACSHALGQIGALRATVGAAAQRGVPVRATRAGNLRSVDESESDD